MPSWDLSIPQAMQRHGERNRDVKPPGDTKAPATPDPAGVPAPDAAATPKPEKPNSD